MSQTDLSDGELGLWVDRVSLGVRWLGCGIGADALTGSVCLWESGVWVGNWGRDARCPDTNPPLPPPVRFPLPSQGRVPAVLQGPLAVTNAMDSSEHAGFTSGSSPWLPVHPDYATRNVKVSGPLSLSLPACLSRLVCPLSLSLETELFSSMLLYVHRDHKDY